MPVDCPPTLVTVTRDQVVESVHRGRLVVVSADTHVLVALGDLGPPVYVRSCAKPFQAVAVLDLLAPAAQELDPEAVAIACASHTGTEDHQIEAARVLALAGLDEQALRCPAALPADRPALLRQGSPDPLAHNCSGQHAAMLYAHVVSGGDPAGYLHIDSPLQRQVRARLAELLSAEPEGPGVDGCGAPAWRLPLAALAAGFARLAGGAGRMGAVRDAMTRHPGLVGGRDRDDTAIMLADVRVVAKRGAEGVFAAGLVHDRLGPLGVAVKIDDGSGRAAGPAVAAALEALGAVTPRSVRRVPVLGGARPHGTVCAVGGIGATITDRLGIS